MKTTMNPLALLLAFTSIAFPASLSAQSEPGHFYLKADAGGTLVEDSDLWLRSFFSRGPTFAGRINFDPGARVGFAAGYQLTDWFATEAELGGTVNTAGKYTTVATASLLFNAKFQYPNRTRWTPYAGGGLGVAAAIFDTNSGFPNGDSGFVRINDTVVDPAFAWQVFAGLRYKLNDRMGLSVEYRYAVVEDPTWEFGEGFAINIPRIETHAFSLAFDVHF